MIAAGAVLQSVACGRVRVEIALAAMPTSTIANITTARFWPVAGEREQREQRPGDAVDRLGDDEALRPARASSFSRFVALEAPADEDHGRVGDDHQGRPRRWRASAGTQRLAGTARG